MYREESSLSCQPCEKNLDDLMRQARCKSNVRSYARKLPLVIARVQGCWATDVEGKAYLGGLAGAGTLVLGHNHKAIVGAIQPFPASGLPMQTLRC